MKYANIDTFRQILQIDDTLNSVYEDARNKRLQLVLEEAETLAENYIGYQANYLPSIYQSKLYTLSFASSFNNSFPLFTLTKTGTYSVDPTLNVFNNKISFVSQTTSGTGLLTCDFPLSPRVEKQLEIQFVTQNSNGGVVGIVYYTSSKAYISDVNIPYNAIATQTSYTLPLTYPSGCAFFKLYITSNTTTINTTCDIFNLSVANKTDPFSLYIFMNSVYRIAEFYYLNPSQFISEKQGQLSETYRDLVVSPALLQSLNYISLTPSRQYAGAKK
jgi:hypothetical protein